MSSIKNILFNKKLFVVLGLIILLGASSYLRFVNLGYSEFQDDEKKTRIQPLGDDTVLEFLLSQRKGPMQFLVAYIPLNYFKVDGYVNELAVRLPFTIASLLSVFVLYAFIFKVTKSHLAAFLVASVYSTNGFVVGFSRIAQYQNLNLLFSFLALYFFSDLEIKKDNFRWSSLLGTVFISLSILSHWDAFFYIVPLVYFLIKFLLRKDVTKNEKLINFSIWTVTTLVLVVPFVVSYITNLASQQSGNVDYLFRRVGASGSELLRHKRIFELYNPVITIWFYLVGILLAIPFFKKTWVFLLWFVFDLLMIKFFMLTPKTHIYNYVIPAIITSCLGIYYLGNFLYKKLPTKFKKMTFILPVLILIPVVLLYVQSYQMFVDHSKGEYPYDAKKILWFDNPILIDNEIITFGFPHYRAWKEVDKHMDTACRYITNESKGISQIYVTALYGDTDGCSYIVRIKRPFYTKAQDVKYPGLKNSKLVYKYVNSLGETVTQVYRMK